MRVLHVISDENIGGAGVLLLNLLRNFDKERVDSVVALPCGSALCERLHTLQIPIRELHAPCDRYSPASVRELGRLIKAERIDIVHANAALCARLAGRLHGKPVVHTRHCCFPPSGIWRFGVVRALGGVWNRMLSDCVISTADAAAENLRAFGIPESKIRVIINGSEPVREVSETELAAARTRWGIRKDDFTVGICARLVPCKGHETFLKAAEQIVQRLPQVPFRFLIVGDGESYERLKLLTHEKGLEERVCFCGFVKDMAPIYRLLRINVNCSTGTETSCLALSEGMSAGVPMVVSDYGGNRAMLGESKAGILYPAANETALAEAVCRIASDPVLESTMRSAAYERYLQHYTAARMTEQVTELYEALLR